MSLSKANYNIRTGRLVSALNLHVIFLYLVLNPLQIQFEKLNTSSNHFYYTYVFRIRLNPQEDLRAL
jgi:hypothetical protein